MTQINRVSAWIQLHPVRSIVGIISIFSLIVFGNISRWSIWFDEAFSAYIIRFNLGEITSYTAADVHPPMYYWTLKVWSGLFGDAELSLRMMSWFFAVIGIIGVYALVRQMVRRKPTLALAAAAGLALSPLIIRYSHEARMYTMVFTIVVMATNVLIIALRKNTMRWWVTYGSLLAVGMLTHYFIAFAWLAHWLWRLFEPGMRNFANYFSRGWVLAHVLAIGLFSWWVPNLIAQFKSVSAGFWIPPVSTKTPIDYLSNTLIYQQYDKASGWWAVAFFVGLAACGYVMYCGLRKLKSREERSLVRLLVIMAILPVVLLFVVSLPPLGSVFMDRYLLYAVGALSVLVAMCLTVALSGKDSRKKRVRLAASLVVISALLGIYNVYYFGNYNKNTGQSIRTREVINEIAAAGDSGQPIIADSPWMYYEAAAYDSEEHPVYYIAPDSYPFGSLAMLRDTDSGKIKDLKRFTSNHKSFWYMSVVDKRVTTVVPPIASWKPVKSVEVYDGIDHVVRYRATLFTANTSEE